MIISISSIEYLQFCFAYYFLKFCYLLDLCVLLFLHYNMTPTLPLNKVIKDHRSSEKTLLNHLNLKLPPDTGHFHSSIQHKLLGYKTAKNIQINSQTPEIWSTKLNFKKLLLLDSLLQEKLLKMNVLHSKYI